MVLGNASRGQERHPGNSPLCRGQLQRALKWLSQAHTHMGSGGVGQRRRRAQHLRRSTLLRRPPSCREQKLLLPLGHNGRRLVPSPTDHSVSPPNTPSLLTQILNLHPTTEQFRHPHHPGHHPPTPTPRHTALPADGEPALKHGPRPGGQRPGQNQDIISAPSCSRLHNLGQLTNLPVCIVFCKIQIITGPTS